MQRSIFWVMLFLPILLISMSCEDFDDDLGDSFGDEYLEHRAASVVVTYQAENRTAASGCQIATEHTGFTGLGFIDYGGNGTWIEWNNVTVSVQAKYNLVFRYAVGTYTRQSAVFVNGQNVGNVGFANTGSWTNWKTDSVQVQLRQGQNTIRIMANTGSGGPNLDRMEISIDDLCPDDPNKTEPGQCGCGAQEGSCDNIDQLLYKETFDSMGGSFSCSNETCSWTSKAIDASGCTKLLISADTKCFEVGQFESADYVRMSYSIDGGDFVVFFENRDDLKTQNVSKLISNNGHSIRIKLDAKTSYHNETYVVDNLLVKNNSGATDQCPNDPNKTEPGACGCGVPDTDSNLDGIPDCYNDDVVPVTTNFLLPDPGTRAYAKTTGNQIIPNIGTYSGNGKAYFGQLHEHSRASDDGNPEAYADDAYSDARNNGMDFMALTDHGRDIDSSVQGEHNKGEWDELTTADDKATINGKFVGLSGYEVTKDSQHINIFNTNWMADRFKSSSDPKNIEKNTRVALNYIKQDPNVIAQFNHPGGYSGGGHLNGFKYNGEYDRFINLIEVSRDIDDKGPEGDLTHYYGNFIRALDKGWHVAPTSQDDNHSKNGKGTMKCQTGVIADGLTQAHILDAMKNRRVYTTNDKNMQVSFKINGQEMGSILNKPSNLSMEVSITDPNGENISKIELITFSGTVVLSYSGSGKWTAELNPLKPYYFIRVYQADGEGAITAPIWTGH